MLWISKCPNWKTEMKCECLNGGHHHMLAERSGVWYLIWSLTLLNANTAVMRLFLQISVMKLRRISRKDPAQQKRTVVAKRAFENKIVPVFKAFLCRMLGMRDFSELEDNECFYHRQFTGLPLELAGSCLYATVSIFCTSMRVTCVLFCFGAKTPLSSPHVPVETGKASNYKKPTKDVSVTNIEKKYKWLISLALTSSALKSRTVQTKIQRQEKKNNCWNSH